jgi:hypothetical protein
MHIFDNRHHADYQARMAMFRRFAQAADPTAEEADPPATTPSFLARWPLPTASRGRQSFASRPR